MVAILTWNIQFGLGVDGRIDLARIARVATALGDADVLCFQEVSAGFAELDHGVGADQVAQLTALFPAHAPIFAPAVDRGAAPRRRFGNMILSRLPVLDVVAHALPRPADGRVIHMQRQALEIIVAVGLAALRVVTTHLEFHSLAQRRAQAERLAALEAEWTGHHANPPLPGKGPYGVLPQCLGTVLCGDFNFEIGEASYAALTTQFTEAWPVLRGTTAHAPTCGIHDAKQWPDGPHARDFFFVSPRLVPRLRGVVVDTVTDASDHQPLMLTLDG